MSILRTIFVASAVAVSGMTAQAADVTYRAESFDTTGTSYSPTHSLWINSSEPHNNFGLGEHFNFAPFGIFTTNGVDDGNLSGTVVSALNAANGFTVNIDYDGDTSGLGSFKNGGGGMTGGSPVASGVWGGTLNPDIFFLNMTGGLLQGFGDILGGLELTLTRKPDSGLMATQIGTGANDKNGNFGMSNWFYMDCGTTCLVNGYDFSFLNGRNGDVNVDLYVDPDIRETPLPGAAWFLIAGLGGLAAAGRRRKAI